MQPSQHSATQSSFLMDVQVNQNQAALYRPIAAWSGRLILPSALQRRSDGGVYLQVENAPKAYQHLLSQQVWLRWHPHSIHQQWLAKATIDIHFDQVTYASQAKNNVHPVRLDGWQQVSPLESLAGARLTDDVQVELDVVAVERIENEWVISINDEPIQILGRLRGLVRFVAPVGENCYRVKHYNCDRQSFDGVEAIISLPDAGKIYPGSQLEQSSIQNIENSPLNTDGWYIYGQFNPSQSSKEQVNDAFIVQALEPAQALSLTPTRMVVGRAEAQAHTGEDQWKQMPLHHIETTLVDSNGWVEQQGKQTTALRSRRTKELWAAGDEALVIHTFGWRGGRRGSKPPLGIVTGHFAFGSAKLVQDEFTQTLRFNLIYHQVYAHNSQGIIAGAYRWHSYMGCLQRGWMYTLPVSDVMVRLPQLTVPYRLNGQIFNPLTLIKQELALMEARYRTGDGNGASIVSPATSCVKDSNQALFAAIRKFQDEVLQDPVIQTWLKDNANDYHAKRFLALKALLALVEKQVLFPLNYVPPNWKGENEEIAAQRRDRTGLATLLEGLKAWRTLLPQRAKRELLRVFVQQGSSMVDYQSAMIGGEIPGIVPLPPSSMI